MPLELSDALSIVVSVPHCCYSTRPISFSVVLNVLFSYLFDKI